MVGRDIIEYILGGSGFFEFVDVYWWELGEEGVCR